MCMRRDPFSHGLTANVVCMFVFKMLPFSPHLHGDGDGCIFNSIHSVTHFLIVFGIRKCHSRADRQLKGFAFLQYNMLQWFTSLMSTFWFHLPDQVREELNRVIGNRQVQVEDRKHLPFTDAVIHEIQRLCVVVPMGLPHRVNQDITFQGYFIKKVRVNNDYPSIQTSVTLVCPSILPTSAHESKFGIQDFPLLSDTYFFLGDSNVFLGQMVLMPSAPHTISKS